jgi:hypothetical protein
MRYPHLMLRAMAKCEMMPVVLNIPDRHDNGAPAMEEVLVDRAAEDAARVRLSRPEAKDALAAGMRATLEKSTPIENYETA